MFKKMQLQLTIFFTSILVVILLGTNLAVYLLLSSFNSSQLIEETNRMLESINSSEWVRETDEIETPSSIDGVEEEKEEDEEEKEEDEEDDEDDEDDEEDEAEEENEVQLTSGELIIPETLRTFSFYFIYDNDGQLLKWKSDFDALNDRILEESQSIEIGDLPRVIEIEDETKKYFLTQKMSIIVNGVQLGYYTVGRDVSIANQTLDNLFKILLVSLVVGMGISVLLGYIIAGRALKPIKEAYFSKQKFLADASHELRTPISVVLLSCDTLEKEDMIDDEFSKQVVKDIRDEALVMRELVERLLNLARYDTKKAVVDYESVNMTPMILSNIKSYQYLASQKQIELEHQVDTGLITWGNPRLLNSLISILVDNGIKYNTIGGKVTITGKNIYLKRKAYIEIQIKDTGEGIDSVHLDQVFERFYRIDEARNKASGGHGLGLSIAKEIVTLHKGKISVTSEVDVGTIFTIILPTA